MKEQASESTYFRVSLDRKTAHFICELLPLIYNSNLLESPLDYSRTKEGALTSMLINKFGSKIGRRNRYLLNSEEVSLIGTMILEYGNILDSQRSESAFDNLNSAFKNAGGTPNKDLIDTANLYKKPRLELIR